MLTYDTIKELCKKKGVTVTGLEKELGFARGSLCKVNTSKPSMEKVQKIADYFNVSADYLMTGKEKDGIENHYLDDETREIAQEISDNSDLKILFDMSLKMSPELLKAHIEFMKKLLDSES